MQQLRFAQVTDDVDVEALVSRIVDIFSPANVAVVTIVNGAGGDAAWGGSLPTLAGFGVASRSAQDLPAGSRVTFVTLAGDAPAARGQLPQPLLKRHAEPVDDSVALCRCR